MVHVGKYILYMDLMGNKSLIKSSTKINQIHHQQQEVIQQYAPVEVLCRDCGGKSTVWNWNTYGQCEASVEVMSHECFWIKTCGNTGNSHATHTYRMSIYRFYMFLLIVHDCSFFSNHTLYTDSLFQPHVNLYIIIYIFKIYITMCVTIDKSYSIFARIKWPLNITLTFVHRGRTILVVWTPVWSAMGMGTGSELDRWW